MNLKFIGKLSVLLFANLLVKPLYIFGVEVEVQNIVGAEAYGQYLSLLNLTIIFSTILDFGVNNFHNQKISQYPKQLNQRFLPTLSLKLGLSWIYAIAVFICALMLGYSSFQLKLLAIILLNQIFLSIIIYNRSTLSALQFFKLDSIASILDKLLMIFIIGGAVWYGNKEFSIINFAWGQTLAYAIALAITSFFVLFRNQYIKKLKLNFKWEQYKKILKSSMPFALLAVLMGLYTRIDGIMLERMLNDNGYQAGVYAAGFRILDGVNQFALLIGYWLLSYFSKLYKEKRILEIKDLTSKLSVLIILGACSIAGFCWIYKVDIMQYLYTEATVEYSLVFGWLMWALPSMALLYVVGTLLTAVGELRLLNSIALVGVVLNLLLNFILIPRLGAWGAAIATVITQSLVIVVKSFYVWKFLKRFG